MITKTLIVCPNGSPKDPNGKPLEGIQFDLGFIARTEARIEEVAIVTTQKAPELMAAFNKAWLDVGEMAVLAQTQKLKAEKHLNEVVATITLDRAPAVLKSKGLTSARSPAGSEDLRKAVIHTDPEYMQAVDRLDSIKAVVELLELKRKAFEMAYTAVKKIYGDSYKPGFNQNNPLLGRGVGEKAQAGQVDRDPEPEQSPERLFGKPRYGG